MVKYQMTKGAKLSAIEHQHAAATAHDEANYAMAFGYPLPIVVYWQRKAAFHAEIARLFMLGSEH